MNTILSILFLIAIGLFTYAAFVMANNKEWEVKLNKIGGE
jgi:hypothetical protein